MSNQTQGTPNESTDNGIDVRSMQESIFNVFAAFLTYDNQVDLEAHRNHFYDLYQLYYYLDKLEDA